MSDIERASVGVDADTAFAVVTRGLKPKLRGIPDVIAVFFAVPAAALIIVYARAGLATAVATVYAGSMVLLFAISATYHTPHWPLRIRRVWRKLDHSAIYVMIAGSYTPVCLLVLPEAVGSWLVGTVWSASALGLLKSFAWERSPRVLNTVIYVVLGVAIAPFIPQLFAGAGMRQVVLWVIGGVLYTIGALIYVRRKPNPWPTHFGYHEIFHLFVVAACVCHYLAFWRVVT